MTKLIYIYKCDPGPQKKKSIFQNLYLQMGISDF